MLVALVEREMSEEIVNYKEGYLGSLRERINALDTVNVEVINKTFGVKIHPIGANYDFIKGEYVPAPVEKYRQAIVDAVKRQMVVRRAKCEAAEIGLAYWPALLQSCNVDPLAFVAAEKALLARGAKPWGTKVQSETSEDPKKIERGGWDSAGHWGISPQSVASCWFASGCKDSKKFRYLVRHTSGVEVGLFGHKLKGLSLRQIKDLRRGQQWLEMHFKYSHAVFSTKAIIALGRISPAARKAVTAGLGLDVRNRYYHWTDETPEGENIRFGRTPDGNVNKVRIRNLNWSAAKALQTMNKEEICSQYLKGRYAWIYLHGVSVPKGLEKVSPVGWSKNQGVWSSRVVTFQEFSTIAPDGYAFGVDENGLKIYEVANPEEDYHFIESEARGEDSWDSRDLLTKLCDNADIRRQRREAEAHRRENDKSYAMMMDNLHLIMVTRFDSYRAGNCAAGTANFANRNSIDQRQLVRADRLHRLAKGGYDTERVMNTIRCAWERETIVMI